MYCDARYAQNVAENGVFLGQTDPSEETKYTWWKVFKLDDKIVACIMTGRDDIRGGEIITQDQLHLYVNDLATATMRLMDTIPNTSLPILGPVKYTSRNFEIIEFVDINDEKCSLQQSSLAHYEQPGSSAVWLGVQDHRMHLDLDQVKALIQQLSVWVDKGSFNP